MKKQYYILLVDDHSLMRQALKVHLELGSSDLIIEEAMNGEHALNRLTRRTYDLLVTDIGMPKIDGFDLTKQIKEKYPTTKVLAVSMHIDPKNVSKMLDAGANGFISKSADYTELLRAIYDILNGKSYYTNDVTDAIINGLRKDARGENGDAELSEREKEVLYLVLKEFSNKEIAKKLYISQRTVEAHKYKLLQKTNSKNVAGLFRYAMQHNLFMDLV